MAGRIERPQRCHPSVGEVRTGTGSWERDGSRTPLIFGTVPAWQASRLNLSRVLGVCGLATFALLEQVRPKEKAAGCEAGPKLPGTLAFWPPKVYE